MAVSEVEALLGTLRPADDLCLKDVPAFNYLNDASRTRSIGC